MTAEEFDALTRGPSAESLTTIDLPIELTPETLTAAKRLSKLNRMWIRASTADDELLIRLRELPPLVGLGLRRLGWSGKVTDKGKAAMLQAGLEWLTLSEAKVVDSAFAAQIAKLPKLRHLTMTSVPIDVGIATELSRCTALRVLSLHRTGLNDEGLAELAKIPTLQAMHVKKQTKVSEAALKKLKEERPELSVE